jgi:hypothetical protein
MPTTEEMSVESSLFGDIDAEANKPVDVEQSLFGDIDAESKALRKADVGLKMAEARGEAPAGQWGELWRNIKSTGTTLKAGIWGVGSEFAKFFMNEPPYVRQVYGPTPELPPELESKWKEATKSPGKMAEWMRSSPLYDPTKAMDQHMAELVQKYVPEEEQASLLHSVVGGIPGIAPAIIGGVYGPALFGVMSMGRHLDEDYDAYIAKVQQEKGTVTQEDKDEAASKAARNAWLSGVKEAAVWYLGPKAIKKYLGDKMAAKAGAGAVNKWAHDSLAGAPSLAFPSGVSAAAEVMISPTPTCETEP